MEIIDQADDKKAAEKGVELTRDKKVDALMKGFIGTGDILRPVVNKETGIRSSTLIIARHRYLCTKIKPFCRYHRMVEWLSSQIKSNLKQSSNMV